MDQEPSTAESDKAKTGNVFSEFAAWWVVLIGIALVFAINFAPVFNFSIENYHLHWLVVVATLFAILLTGLTIAGLANLLTGRTMTHRQFMWVVSVVIALIMTPRTFQAARAAYARIEHEEEFRAFYPHISKIIEPKLSPGAFGFHFEGRISNQTPKKLREFSLRIRIHAPDGSQTTSLARIFCSAEPHSVAQFKHHFNKRLPEGYQSDYQIVDATWE